MAKKKKEWHKSFCYNCGRDYMTPVDCDIGICKRCSKSDDIAGFRD